ncbi:hypothetical protein TOTORO_02260 [Serratia phage vB_SmaS-Totoro]|nr:hypothetical protein TOTORO_02260 [Serratia phage vB_SmaS-Totoro]
MEQKTLIVHYNTFELGDQKAIFTELNSLYEIKEKQDYFLAYLDDRSYSEEPMRSMLMIKLENYRPLGPEDCTKFVTAHLMNRYFKGKEDYVDIKLVLMRVDTRVGNTITISRSNGTDEVLVIGNGTFVLPTIH